MNRDILDVPGEGFYHRYVLGYYSVVSRLTGMFPQVLFEGCSSGGGRFDPGVLAYMPQIWTSDNTDAISRLKIQYSTSMCYPLSAISNHVSAVPNHPAALVMRPPLTNQVRSLAVNQWCSSSLCSSIQ